MKELRDDDCYLLFNDVSDDPSTEVSLHELCRRRETKRKSGCFELEKYSSATLGLPTQAVQLQCGPAYTKR